MKRDYNKERRELHMEEQQYLLSTVDNPFNPWTEYDDWLRFDEQSGYYSNQLLARVSIDNEDLNEELQEQLIQIAILEIIKENVSGMHRRVPRPA